VSNEESPGTVVDQPAIPHSREQSRPSDERQRNGASGSSEGAGVTFTTGGRNTCDLEECLACPWGIAQRDMLVFDMFIARKYEAGKTGCRRVDPRTVSFVPPERKEQGE